MVDFQNIAASLGSYILGVSFLQVMERERFALEIEVVRECGSNQFFFFLKFYNDIFYRERSSYIITFVHFWSFNYQRYSFNVFVGVYCVMK